MARPRFKVMKYAPRGWIPTRDNLWTIPVAGLTCMIALGLGLFVGFKIYAPTVVRQFKHVLSTTSNNTQVFDAADNLIATLEGVENRHTIPISRIHPYMQKTVVAIEDRRFFAHRGMDPIRLAGALWADLKAMGYEQGASTITQQLVKLTLLSSEKTITRKVKEIFMAMALEEAFPKMSILEFYLNRVYLGNGLYGVEKASQAYFHKHASELSLAESAFLASLVKKPEGYLAPAQPGEAPEYDLSKTEDLGRRWGAVLASVRNLGWVTAEEYNEAINNPPVVFRPKRRQTNAPYFVQEVSKELREVLGVESVSGKGLRVYTTLDPTAQRAAETLVNRFSKRRNDDRQLSLVALDPHAGFVRAMVGGVDFEVSQFNRATQAQRQPGSAIKPLLYTAALENGFQPNTIFQDEPVRYTWDDEGNYRRVFERDYQTDLLLGRENGTELGENTFYTPRNYDDRYGLKRTSADSAVLDDRRMTLTKAIEVSSNVIAVQLLDKLGMHPFQRLATRLDMPQRVENGLCIALGCSEVALITLTAAYGAFANGGYRVSPVYIRMVTDAEGTVLYEHFPTPPSEVISPWSAFQMRQMLQGVVRRGTGWRARLDRPSGGKTGTNDGPKDAWFIGFTPSLVAGVWTGYDDNKVMPYEAGGRTPAAVWRDFMKAALPPYSGERFPEPGVEYVGIRVCNQDGRVVYPGCLDSSQQYFRKDDMPQDLLAQTLVQEMLTQPDDDVRVSGQFDNTDNLEDLNRPAGQDDRLPPNQTQPNDKPPFGTRGPTRFDTE